MAGLQGVPISAEQAQTIGAYRRFTTLAPSQPDDIRLFTTSGGTATVGSIATTLSTDATASEGAVAVMSAARSNVQAGTAIGYFMWAPNQGQSNLAENYEIGFIGTGADASNIAAFRPSAGDDTSGNIRVDSGGSDNDGTLSYPALNGTFHRYAIRIDFDAGVTEFYVDKDPLSEPADATISATPNQLREPGFAIFSGTTDANEELQARLLGYIVK